MGIFIEALQSILIPQIAAAIIGGLFGACISIKVELYGWRISILIAVSSLIITGAISEYLAHNFNVDSVLAQCGLGILIGILGNSLLNAINAQAPIFMENLMDVLSNGIIQVAKELPNIIISKLEELFQWFKLFIRKEKDE